MSLDPNASTRPEPPKCATCEGAKKNQQVAEVVGNEAGDRSIEIVPMGGGNHMVTTFDGNGKEIGTWHVDASGQQR